MIDLKQLRADPQRFVQGARDKGVTVDVRRLLELDEQLRQLKTDVEARRAEQNKISKEIGPQLGKIKGQLKAAQGPDRDKLEAQARELEAKPAALKAEIQQLEAKLAALQPDFDSLLLQIPQPPDPDVPRGTSAEDNIELKKWNPKWF